MSKRKKFKYLEIVTFEPSWGRNASEYERAYASHPLRWNETVLFLGNIPNAEGHCAVAKHSGEVIWLVHPEDFRKATDEEL